MSSPSPQRRVPVVLEPLADLEKGTMSQEVWKELNNVIQYEAASVQATGVIVPSPARTRGKSNSPSNTAAGTSSPNQEQQSSSTQDSGSISTKFPQRFPAMESFFQALATMGLHKQNYRGLAMLHNAAHLGIWMSSSANAQMRAELHDKVQAQSEAIDETLRATSERARVLREEQARELAKPGDDAYVKQLQANRIDAEFERMRDQLRAEDAARREQLEYAREQKSKQAQQEALADRKNKLQQEREQRQRDREEKTRELQKMENSALDSFEHALKEHQKVGKVGGSSSPEKSSSS